MGPVAAGGYTVLSGGIKSDNNAQNITLKQEHITTVTGE